MPIVTSRCNLQGREGEELSQRRGAEVTTLALAISASLSAVPSLPAPSLCRSLPTAGLTPPCGQTSKPLCPFGCAGTWSFLSHCCLRHWRRAEQGSLSRLVLRLCPPNQDHTPLCPGRQLARCEIWFSTLRGFFVLNCAAVLERIRNRFWKRLQQFLVKSSAVSLIIYKHQDVRTLC